MPSLLGINRRNHRPLGVAITQIILRHAGVATYFDYHQPPLREAGCYPHENGCCWTDGELALPVRFFSALAGAFMLLVQTEPHPDLPYPLAARAALAA